MTPSEITDILKELFGTTTVNVVERGSWQVEMPDFRLLVLLSEDEGWLRLLLPIMTFQEAQPFLEQFLEANFDRTQEVRYALNQGVVWGIFQHSRESLAVEDFKSAVTQLVSLQQAGVDDVFNNLIESRIRRIIATAKIQGQSLEATMQTLNRFYAEGLMGDRDQTPQEREQVLAAWRRRLEELWNEVG